MALIADMLLAAGAIGAAVYCLVLSRRLRRFNDLESGMGGAIATLSAQVDEMTRALEAARDSARHSSSSLEGLTARAEDTARRLELLVASLHDLPLGGGPAPGGESPAPARQPRAASAADASREATSAGAAEGVRAGPGAERPERPDGETKLSFIRSARASTLVLNGAGKRARESAGRKAAL